MGSHQIIVTIADGVRARSGNAAANKVMELLDDPIIDALQDDAILGFSTDITFPKPARKARPVPAAVHIQEETNG